MLTDMPNIIVTGGCGFIGSHLVQQLSEQGFAVTVVAVSYTHLTLPTKA